MIFLFYGIRPIQDIEFIKIIAELPKNEIYFFSYFWDEIHKVHSASKDHNTLAKN